MQLSRTHRMALLTLFFTGIVIAAAPGVHGAPKELGTVLLDAPINATWAANHGDNWRAKGFRGFLFEGLLDDLTLFPSEKEQAARLSAISPAETHEKESSDSEDVATDNDDASASDDEELLYDDVTLPFISPPGAILPGNWDSLAAELTGAVNRLKSHGLDRNFLRISIAPEAPYFTDPFLLECAESRLHLAGTFCRKTGLRGIAVDTQSLSAIHDMRWDGYSPDADPKTLEAGARRFGMRVLRAFIRTCPDGELLLLAQTPEAAPPLWFAMLGGMLESVGAAHSIKIRLVIHDEGPPDPPVSYQTRRKRLDNLFQTALSQRAYQLWELQGGLVFSFEPIRYEGDMPKARYPLEAYRSALYGAALYGNDYAVIAAPEGGWWHIPPDIAEQFSPLHQKGRARVRFSPPVPKTLEPYFPTLSIADAVLIGTIPVGGKEVEVLSNKNGAALLAWDGLSAELRMTMRTGAVTVTDLITEKQQYHTPQADEVVVPTSSGLQLIEGLPMRAFALPASMHMNLRTPIVAGITGAEMEIDLYNPLTLPLRGTLTLGTETSYALGAASIAVNIAPGQSTVLRRRLQGISRMGHCPSFTLNLLTTTDEPVVRTFTFSVEPPERYRFRMDGPALGMPIALRNGDQRPPDIIMGDSRGSLVYRNTATNEPIWNIRVLGRFTQGPVVTRNDDGVPYIATQNANGRLRFYDLDGAEKVIIYPTGTTFGPMTAVWEQNSKAAHLATTTDNGTVSVYATTGTLRSRFNLSDGTIAYLASGETAPGSLFIVTSGSTPEETSIGQINHSTIYAHHVDGTSLWETSLPGTASCEPVVFVSCQNIPPMLCVGDTSGAIHCYHVVDGSDTLHLDGEEMGATTHLAVFEHPTDGEMFIAQADENIVRLHSLQGSANDEPSIRWSLPFSHITAMTPLPDNKGIVVGLAEGSVYAIHADGQILWEDHRGSGAVTGITLYMDTTKPDTCICVVGSQAGLVRILEIRKALFSTTST